MSDDQRVYSDEEFAILLRKATELASRAEPSASAEGGLTLAEMKAAAAQVGFDPALVERAARMLAVSASASPLERLIGGPMRHDHTARFPSTFDENRAALLLSAVRISAGLAGRTDAGHSGSMGMTWHDGGESEALRVTARPEEDGTVVSVVLDRRGTLAVVAVATGITIFFVVLFAGSALYPESPAQGYGGLIIGVGGALAAARGYWASSTRKVRERIGAVMDTISKTLIQPVVIFAFALLCTPSGLFGQALHPDSLFPRLVGQWVLRGTIARQQTVHDVRFEWLLGREYVQMREVSRERTPAGAPAYEAVVLFGRDPKTGAYACVWMDNTASAAFPPEGTGRGSVAGDSISFLFQYTATTSFHTTFVYDRVKDSWQWHMDNDSSGVRRPFARVILTRR